jgi:N-acetylglucosamine-6-sulfatase
MKRVLPLALILATAAACTSTSIQLRPTPPGPHEPNIVFIVTDDETYAEIHNVAANPHLYADLIRRGVTFSDAIVPNPLCCPSRTSILRGQLSSRTGLWTNRGDYGGWSTAHSSGLEDSTIATWLRQRGYETGLVGKYLNGYQDATWVPPGWSYWRAQEIDDQGGGYFNYRVSVQGQERHFGSDPKDYSVDVMTRFATAFIRRTPTTVPLFLYVAYRSPHGPRTAAPRYANDRRCDGVSVTDRPDYRTPGEGAPSYLLDAPPIPEDMGTVEPQAACRSLLAVDDGIGAITRALAETGRLSDTLIAFISDNGFMYGEHDWESKRVPFESSIHVPLVIRYDPITRARAGTVNDSVVANIDLAPTAAAVAHVTPPLKEDGISLVPLLRGHVAQVRDGILLEAYSPDIRPPVPSYCGWRTSRYVYVRYVTGEQQLYDLSADPYEMRNLAADPAMSGLRTRLEARARTNCRPLPPDWTSFP